MAVRTLESVIDYQDYPVLAGETFTKNRRSLGVGVTNLAGFLAKNKLKYDDQEALELVHETMEQIQWNLINASCELAEEKGACEKFEDTKYAKGLLPIDWYKKEVDELIVLDIDATVEKRKPNFQMIKNLATECRMPLCYGGGVTTPEDAKKIIKLGAEKVH